MSDFNFLNRCMIIHNPEKGFIEMEQFLIYIVRQNVFNRTVEIEIEAEIFSHYRIIGNSWQYCPSEDRVSRKQLLSAPDNFSVLISIHFLTELVGEI